MVFDDPLQILQGGLDRTQGDAGMESGREHPGDGLHLAMVHDDSGAKGRVIRQNREYFFTKQALSLSLGVETWHWTAPGVENVYYFGGCLLIGLLFAGFIGLSSKLRSKRAIKSLNATIESHLEMISSLKSELEKLKGSQPADEKATVTEVVPEPEIEAESEKEKEKEETA